MCCSVLLSVVVVGDELLCDDRAQNSKLQRVVVCCSVLQCVAVCCRVLLCVAVRCSVL